MSFMNGGIGKIIDMCGEGPLARDHHVGIFEFSKLLAAACRGDADGLDEWERLAIESALGHPMPTEDDPSSDDIMSATRSISRGS